MKALPLSHSSIQKYKACPRWWYLYKIKGIHIPSDMSYADGGTVVHSCLEKYYNDEITQTERLKKYFSDEWDKKKLSKSKISDKKDVYWMMVLNSINKNIKATSTELKLFFKDFICYIDFINTKERIIRDHKSSTRTKVNEEEYTEQALAYSWACWRHFGWIPEKCYVDYLKYDGSRGELEVSFSLEQVEAYDREFNELKKEMCEVENKNIEPKRKDTIKECAHWCPYKEQCFAPDKELKYVVEEKGSELQLDINDPFLENHITKKFTYTDKSLVYMKKRFPNMKTQKTIYNFNEKRLPSGCYKALMKTLYDYAEFKKLPIKVFHEDKRLINEQTIKMPDKLSKELRDYQEKAVEKFLLSGFDRNMINFGTGGGKTLTAMELIRKINMKTIFIVDRKELMYQTYDNLVKEFGLENVGIYGDGKDNKNFITVAMVQTLIKRCPLDYMSTISFAIFDECHKASAESYFKVNQWLKNTRWTLGLTATPFRDDGKDMLINAVCGYPCFTKSSEELIKEGYLVKPTVTFINNFDNTDYKKKELIINDYFRELCNHDKIVMEKKKAELYRSYYKTFIVKNEARNNKIQELVEENSDKKILIMVKSVEHGQMLSGQLKVPYISGKLNKKERSQHFDDFKGEKLNILIGTFSIFSEGIDIPAIDMVINAGANSGSVKTIQMIGRALRAKVGKNNAVYYDFKDPYKFLNFASVKRQKALKKEGYMITIQNRI